MFPKNRKEKRCVNDKKQSTSKESNQISLKNLLKLITHSLYLVGCSRLTTSDVKMGIIIFRIKEKQMSSENLPLDEEFLMDCLAVSLTRVSTRQ